MRFILTPGVLAVLLTGVGMWTDVHAAPQGPVPKNVSRSPLEPCRVPGVEETLRCGSLAVYENRESGTGRKIHLEVVVLPALEPKSKAAPLFDLAGGPGIAATGAAGLYATELEEYRRHRDVVLVDQRGTGGSNPLHCRHETTPQSFLDAMFPTRDVKRCREELVRRADLTQYTTPIAADDLDDVRAWLGYERINLIGVSYGARMALVYMRRHPTRVRAAVLMGVTPTYHKGPLYHARDGQRAIDLLLDECAADPDCDRAAPNLRWELKDLLARLGRTPARVQYALPESGETVPVEIRRAIFAEELRSQMYEAQKARRLPLVIHRAALGDFGPFLDLAIPAQRSSPDFIATGMYLSVTCAEDTALIEPAEAARLTKGTFFGDYRVFQQRRACGMWPRAKLPDDYHRPVASDAPVLILSGQMDPVTPPEWAAEVAGHLPNSRHVILPHEGHLPDGPSDLECLDSLVIDFLNQGDAKAVDASCVDEMLPPPFLVDLAN